MFRRYFSLLRKDILSAWRNYFFLVVAVLALIFAGLIRFLVPEEITIKPEAYYFNEYQEAMEWTLRNIVTDEEYQSEKFHKVDSREAVISGMRANLNSIGIVIKAGQTQPVIELIFHGFENQSVRNLLKISIQDNLNRVLGDNIDFETIILKENLNIKTIAANKSIVPIFLMSEAALVGFIVIAAFIFMEKDEGTLRAYQVSPGRTPEYLAAKISLMIILGWVHTVILVPLTIGVHVNWLPLIMIVTLGSIVSSSLGLIVASFFQNLSQAIVWIIAGNMLLGLPMVSYFVPSFAPAYIQMMPTYPILFGIREALFTTNNTGMIRATYMILAAQAILTFLLAVITYKRQLVRD
ncbi:ABC-2 type transport system permease protein [Geosporobacter subterraneus DSM 17957]|uniref:ABC-2 type transport system permease protein n=1 Tax=Geosporobacter subterraneus DSM 17957 TaxID=1121919 RepID=A0A1M6NBP1_9FIRM|nr:ABC transporter permease [Geosporobacter subterraneus]SHJ93077.1 ABC-2 type transport system permease protein [Geosporobacter subterraneus DSM 17957]